MHAPEEEGAKRILFVDDDPLVRAALGRVARVWGYVPDVAASAEEAWALLAAWTYAVVVTDIHMPGVGGWALLDRLAQLSPDTARVVMTGDTTVTPARRGTTASFEIVGKPLDLRVLEQLLARLCSSGPAPRLPSLPPPRVKGDVRALIVEDSVTDASILERSLKTARVCETATIVTSLAAALQAVRRGAFDVVLADLQLPDSSGLATVRSILAAAPHVPLVVVSGNDDEHLAERAIEAGAQDYLIKGELARSLVGRVLRHAIERKKIEVRLLQLATRDQLTGLVSRLFFRERVAAALARNKQSGHSFAVVAVDIDDFRVINDSLGHDAGDALLRQIAERLVNEIGSAEVVGRMGSNEFAVLLEGIENEEGARQLAENCGRCLGEPFYLTVGLVSVSAHVGVAFHPLAGSTVDALIGAANAAMYRSKRLGLDEVSVFSPELHNETLESYRLDQRLRSALAEGEFHLVFQPQVAAGATTRIVGAEVLLRWSPRGDKPVSPAVFVPLLERSGQIVEVGRWVLREACAFRARLLAVGAHLPRLGVNVSGCQLERPDFLQDVKAVCFEFQLGPGDLELEITEAALVRQATVAAATIRDLRALGVRFSLDDFGTGYSSMSYLREFPVDTLKVDQSLVRRLTEDAKSVALAAAIFNLGRGLGLETVAEGVETDAEREIVVNLGADVIQGYLTGRPLDPESFQRALLESQKLHPADSRDTGAVV